MTSKQVRGVAVDVAAMPRLDQAEIELTPEQEQRFGLGRHPSMDEFARRTLMWAPDLHEAQSVLAAALRASTRLSPRDREIAILRQAWDAGSDYQWSLHADMAKAAGLSDEEIDRLAGQPPGAGWAPHETAVIEAVDELHESCIVGDATWQALATHYDGHQIVELLVLVGSYRLLAYVINSVGIVPPGGSSPDVPGNTFLYSPGPA